MYHGDLEAREGVPAQASQLRGLVAAHDVLLIASLGALGLRRLAHLRQILMALNVLVLSEQFALPRAHEAFDVTGELREPRHRAALAGVARRLAEVTARLTA